MLERKFTQYLEYFLTNEPDKILLVNGARQIGKSYLVRYVGKRLFKHFVEINLKEDKEGDQVRNDQLRYPAPLSDKKKPGKHQDEFHHDTACDRNHPRMTDIHGSQAVYHNEQRRHGDQIDIKQRIREYVVPSRRPCQ